MSVFERSSPVKVSVPPPRRRTGAQKRRERGRRARKTATGHPERARRGTTTGALQR